MFNTDDGNVAFWDVNERAEVFRDGSDEVYLVGADCDGEHRCSNVPSVARVGEFKGFGL